MATPVRLIARRRAKTSPAIFGDRPAEGSSRISTAGSTTSARATASICRCPPDSAPARAAGTRGEVREGAVERGDPPSSPRPRQDLRGELEILVNAQRREDVLGLRHEGETVPHLLVRGRGGCLGAGEADLPGMHRHEAGDRLDEGRLAGAVRPEQRHELAGGDGEVDAAHDRQVALVAGDERDRLERRGHAGSPR